MIIADVGNYNDLKPSFKRIRVAASVIGSIVQVNFMGRWSKAFYSSSRRYRG